VMSWFLRAKGEQGAIEGGDGIGGGRNGKRSAGIGCRTG